MLEADRSLCIVGCGTMGEAIVGGLLRAGWIEPRQIAATTRRQAQADAIAGRLRIHTSIDNAAAMSQAQVVILCLKPQRFAKVLEQEAVTEALRGKLVISIAAGATMPAITPMWCRCTCGSTMRPAAS